jgi:hypothetical protein
MSFAVTPARTALLAATVLLALAAGCASGGRNAEDSGTTTRPDVGRLDGAPNAETGVPDGGGGDGGMADAAACVDEDGDGFGVGCSEPDCDDTDAMVSPAGTEACNGVDDDCDDSTDEDLDAPVFCGTGACRTSVPTCSGGTMPTCTPLPAGTETCNGIDDNCDGSTDEGFGGTTCGIGECARTVAACSGGTPPMCVPGMPSTEVCNGLDDDCNTMTDDALGNISCGRGACLRSTPACSGGVPGTCVPGSPSTESCNNIDDNCDGVIDDGFGSLTCGTGACFRTVAACSGGVPGSCVPGAAGTESCNSVDDNCNGVVDDGIAMLSCGVGACARTAPGCTGGSVPACVPGTPAASETCGNGIDDNCSGAVDEGCCAAPTNATCATAAAYTVGSTVSGDNSCSGAEYTSTCGSTAPGNDVAYSFVSSGQPLRYTFTMTGAAGYDTILSLMSSSACTTAQQLICNDDFLTTNVSQFTVDLPAGTMYLVADSYSVGSTPRTFTLSSSTTAINNDTCTTPVIITANGAYNGSTTTRTSNYATAPCQTSASGPDVIYQLTARTAGTISINTVGSAFDTILSVGTTCGAMTTACDDDGGGSLTSSTSFAAVAGTTYYIIVDGYAGASGNYVLNVSGY